MISSYYEKIGDNVNCIDENIPFDIPDTWEWMRLKNCCSKEIRRGKSPKYADESGTLVFAQKCNTKYNGIDVGLALYLDETTLSRYPADEYMQDGDVVVNSTGTGTLGRVGFYQMADNRLELPIVPDSHITVVRGSSNIQAFYLIVAGFLSIATGIVCLKMPLLVTSSKVFSGYNCICSNPFSLIISKEESIYLHFISLEVTQSIFPSQYSRFDVEGVLPPENAAMLDNLSHAHPVGISNGISSSIHFSVPSANFS